MKKRIGNDIHFVWHIFRKDGDIQTPESFTGKEVEVKLISPLQRPVTIEDVSIATGVVTFTFRGKHQVTLGNYVAILQENRGEDGMVTIDVVSAVSLVAHSYMEEDGDDGDVIEATSVELDSEIGQGIDAYTKAESDELFVKKIFDEPGVGTTYFSPTGMFSQAYDEHGMQNSYYNALGWSVYDGTDNIQTFRGTIYKGGIGTINSTRVIWEKTATQQIPAATTEENGLMSAADKGKLNDLPTATELAQELGGKANSADLAEVATSGSYNDLTNKPTIPDISGKADKNEMSVVPGTGADADKTTITLKQGTSATVLTAHQDISGKADSSSLASVATSGSYNDLFDKPTIQDLATVKHIYALDSTNPDYPSLINNDIHLDTTSVFGTISIVTLYSDGTERGLTDLWAQSFPNAQYTIDNTTYTSYYYNSEYYLGIRVPFFKANVAQYGNDYTFGVIKFTSTNNGVFKVHAIGVTPSNCIITVNGVTTPSLTTDMVAVQVNAGDVVKVITTTTTADYYVRIIGFVLEGNCGVSVFVNDAGYITNSVDNLVNYYLKSETYTKTEVQQLIGAIQQFHYEVYPTLPQTGASNVLYLIGPTGTGADKYEEYVYANNDWTKIGDTSIDLSGYVTTQALNTALADYVTSSALSTALAGKADKSEMSVVPGTGANADKTTITLKQGTSATVLTAHQDISGKENIMPITTATGATLTAVVGNYYRLDNVGTLTITLPTITGATKLQAITFLLICGSNAVVIFVPQDSETILYQEDFALEADTTYEVTALWNGSEWTLSRVIYE